MQVLNVHSWATWEQQGQLHLPRHEHCPSPSTSAYSWGSCTNAKQWARQMHPMAHM